MEEEQDDQGAFIDPELWLEVLLALTADPARKEELVKKIAENTGVIPENVEKILAVLLNTLANRSRSN